MKRNLIAATVLTGVLAATSSVTFAATKAVGSGPNPYSDCGIGAALFPETHWAAALSNVIWDLGSTAVTSATASPETCNGKKAETAQFILDNYDTLAEEAARGEGEHLSAMYNVLGCKTAAQPGLTAAVRAGMANEVTANDYSEQHPLEKASALYNIVNTAVETEFSDSCSA